MSDGQQLIVEYVKTGSEAAFEELVTRYLDLVYSAAIRLVNGDAHMAEDITQTVFADLARMVRTFSKGVMLGGWLHRHTCFVASKALRTERRRQSRERQAVEMNSIEDHSAANLRLVAPILDEAINELGTDDRQAILLRFFEQRDFRSVGEALGSNEEAARKRVNRALDKLESLLKRRGVALSAAALGTALGAQAVTAAPVGMAAAISVSALASAAAGTGTTLTFIQIMGMTKLKAGIITAIAAAVVGVPFVIQYQAQTKLREENEALRAEVQKIKPLAAENERLANLVAEIKRAPASTNDQQRELLKLRGEVGRLRQDVTAAVAPPKAEGPSPLSGMTENPEMHKFIRDQQKGAMTMIYKDMAKNLKLSKEQTEKLNDLLADNIMTNINHISAALRDKKSPQEADQIFADEERVLQAKVQEMLGPDGFIEYQNYTRNIASDLSGKQFSAMLEGEKDAKEKIARQLSQIMQEETQQALAGAGLDPDFQTVPSLNFRNFAYQEEAERNIKLLDGIYEKVAARSGSFLGPKELEKFGEFRAAAINNNRLALEMNRKMMSPGTK